MVGNDIWAYLLRLYNSRQMTYEDYDAAVQIELERDEDERYGDL